MKIYLLFLFLITRQFIGSCQDAEYSYNKIIKKISENKWWYYKDCENDTCYALEDDSMFFYVGIWDYDLSNRSSRIKTQKHIRCLTPRTTMYMQSPIDSTFSTIIVHDAIPCFCFIDTDIVDNTYQIYTLGEDGLYNAEMIFTSDNEFYIRRIDTFKNKNTIQKFYYKSRGLK